MMKPNILIIYTDQQRFDTLGCNGNPLIQTPNIDALATNGCNYLDAHVSCPICVPSRVGMFTGQWGIQSGSTNNSGASFLQNKHDDLFHHLKSHHYTTALIGKNHCIPNDQLDEYLDYHTTATHTAMDNPRTDDEKAMCEVRSDKMQAPIAEEPTPAQASITNWCADACIEYLQEDRDKPFCCWLSIPDPHPPYMVCEPYASMYDNVDVPGPVWREGEMDNKPARQRIAVELDRFSGQYPEPNDIIQLRKTYWGMVSQIDDAIGRVIDTLEQTQQLDNTIIIYTSDHGDYMGDHRLIRKGVDCYSATTHVPMIWHWSNKIKHYRGDAQMSNTDIYPTLCELVDIPCPDSVQGKSHAAFLTGDDAHVHEYIFSHHGDPGQPLQDIPATKREELIHDPHNNFLLSRDWYSGHCFAIRNKQWSYMMTPGDVDELYDRNKDPNELTNLASDPQYAATINDLRERLINWVQESNAELMSLSPSTGC